MGPIAALWAREMAARGHEVEVIAAHPHYPPDVWQQRLRPYREVRDGIRILRLPLWIGHSTGFERVREELSHAVSAGLAMTAASTPDVIVTVSPSFLALAPTMANAVVRRRPWVLWLQDIVPDAAVTTGLLTNRGAVGAARALERTAYRSASRIVVISETFEENLRGKGVASSRMTRIYNPATLGFASNSRYTPDQTPPRILYMGNIGHSQGLVEVVRAFQASRAAGVAKLVIVGHGELASAVREEARAEFVEVLGLVDSTRLESELQRASIGLVSQRSDILEFNVPSKLMNLMARGIPVLTTVSRRSETARIVSASGAGWVITADTIGETVARILQDQGELETRGKRAFAFAQEHFHPKRFAERFDDVLADVSGRYRVA
jgi:colanic acid biosynthesis glycosyl transferase WcaI